MDCLGRKTNALDDGGFRTEKLIDVGSNLLVGDPSKGRDQPCAQLRSLLHGFKNRLDARLDARLERHH